MKSYHGLRIHLNNGENEFEETYFFPMNGCTRVIADDFDQDQDIDLVLLSTFPDYKDHYDEPFIYLENTSESKISFKPYRLSEPNLGRWFLMDSGDFDKDGDVDLVLSSLTYTYSTVPQELDDKWKNENVDLLLLKNNLY